VSALVPTNSDLIRELEAHQMSSQVVIPMSNFIHSSPERFPSMSTLAPVLARITPGSDGVAVDPDDLNVAGVRRSVKCVLLSADHHFCALVRSYLQHLGFCVFTCSSSDRAERQFLERRDIDLWVVDVEALGVDAMYLAARVRELHTEIAIVVISEARQDATACRPFPWHGWIRIRKPIQLPDLLAVIQRALAPVPKKPNLVPPPGCDPEPFENQWMIRLRQNHLMN
jgi:two-component system, chemotaxis family, chemotaxis protein CheY